MGERRGPIVASPDPDFPLEQSIGALVRFTHRAFAEDLQVHLSAHQVNVGMWYFLRALWQQDGLTQRELCRLIGVSEPTAAQQLKKMAAQGLITRDASGQDKRKRHIKLTRAGRQLKQKLIPYAAEVNQAALAGISAREVADLRRVLEKIRTNLQRRSAARGA